MLMPWQLEDPIQVMVLTNSFSPASSILGHFQSLHTAVPEVGGPHCGPASESGEASGQLLSVGAALTLAGDPHSSTLLIVRI